MQSRRLFVIYVQFYVDDWNAEYICYAIEMQNILL